MTIDTATTVIAEIAYKPGWSFTVTPTAAGSMLVIGHPDGDPEWIPMPLLSVRTMTTRRLVGWVADWVRDIELRSVDRCFRYAGKALDEIPGP